MTLEEIQSRVAEDRARMDAMTGGQAMIDAMAAHWPPLERSEFMAITSTYYLGEIAVQLTQLNEQIKNIAALTFHTKETTQ